MKTLLNSKLFYLLFPIYFSLILVLAFYHIPDGFYLSLLTLFFVVTPVALIVGVMFPLRMEIDRACQSVLETRKYKLVALTLCCIVVMAGPFDIFVNGFKLLNPETYTEFNGYGRYVRHISILSWILVPVAFIFVKNLKIRTIFIAYAIIFPILIIDRNRLLAAFYAIIVCATFLPKLPSNRGMKTQTNRKQLVVFFLLGMLVFAGIGIFRSGTDAFTIETSGSVLREGALPLREEFYYLPVLVQQIVLYITTPVFNFATICYYDFINPDFLISQISPFSREEFDAYPYAPVMLPKFNVGTEFYPWLLYGGVPLVIAAYTFISISLLSVAFLFKRFPNIFTFLIFLKISYMVLFMGFAPQFYLLLTLGFMLLMILLWFTSFILDELKLHSDHGRKGAKP